MWVCTSGILGRRRVLTSASTAVNCVHTCLHIWVPKGSHIWRTLGAQLGRGRLFHKHLGQQGSPGCSHLGGSGHAAAFTPTAGEVPHVSAGHRAEGTGMPKHIWRTRWLPCVHIWRACTSGELAQTYFSTPRAVLSLQTHLGSASAASSGLSMSHRLCQVSGGRCIIHLSLGAGHRESK